MSIEAYFQDLLAAIKEMPNVHTSDVALDKRGPQAGLIRGDVQFADGSLLHFRELVDLESERARQMYSYHYQRSGTSLVFRYDDTPHYLGLPNFPHHKHSGGEENVLSVEAPDLRKALAEIKDLLGTEGQKPKG